MSHKTKIAGTEYEIIGGKTKINSTGYDIAQGKTKIGGTSYDILFKPNWTNPTIYQEPSVNNGFFYDTPIYYNGYFYGLYYNRPNSLPASQSSSLYSGVNIFSMTDKGTVGGSYYDDGMPETLSLVNGKLIGNNWKRANEDVAYNPRLYYGTPTSGSVTWNSLLFYSAPKTDTGQQPISYSANWFHYNNGVYYGFFNKADDDFRYYFYPIRFDNSFNGPVEIGSYWLYDGVNGGRYWRSSYMLNNKIFLPWYYYYQSSDGSVSEYTRIQYIDLNTTDYIEGRSSYSVIDSSQSYYPLTMLYKNDTYYAVFGYSNHVYIYYTSDPGRYSWNLYRSLSLGNHWWNSYNHSASGAYIDETLIIVLFPEYDHNQPQKGHILVSEDLSNFETYEFDPPLLLEEKGQYWTNVGNIRKARGHYYIKADIVGGGERSGYIFQF